MQVGDIINALYNGELTGSKEQQMVAELIEALCELLDKTIDREYDHLKEIEKLKNEIRSMKFQQRRYMN